MKYLLPICIVGSIMWGASCSRLPVTAITPTGSALNCGPFSMAPPVANPPSASLVFPGLLERDALLSGNPLATYAAMRVLEPQYAASEVFRGIYPEVRLNFEEFLGDPCAGVQAMSRLGIVGVSPVAAVAVLDSVVARPAIDVIRERAAETQIVIWSEEHHLPQTRSLYEPMLRALWALGYRYLAAETFARDITADAGAPNYASGYYLRDPIFASAVRVARKLGYILIPYDTTGQGSASDISFRDVAQARNIATRVFDRDSNAKVLILAGRAHGSEIPGADGWTPMAHVLKRLTGIDPFTLYSPTMTERLKETEEDALYQAATTRGFVQSPVILQHRRTRRFVGAEAFDAYVFFPRTQLIGGRPDWFVTTLGRKPLVVPPALRVGSGTRLIQAFERGAPATEIPQDQVIVQDNAEPPVLMLPKGEYWLRSIDSGGRILGTGTVVIP